MTPAPAWRAVLVGTTLLLLLAAACGGTEGESDPQPDDDSRRALEQQRAAVRSATADVIGRVETALPGTRNNLVGGYRGCESSGVETFGSFRYVYSARVDAGGGTATRPYVDAVATTLSDADYDVDAPEDEPGRTLLRATRGGVSVLVTERVDAGDFLLVSVDGPCVDVPSEDSDYWLTRREDEPLS